MDHTWRRDPFVISTDPERLDLDVIHGFLTTSYWAAGIPREIVAQAVRHSLCFGVYDGGTQVGFARVITDRATFGYLADVFVVPSHRGQGLSKWLMACIDEHPDLHRFRRWLLLTRDAHGLYRQFGWTSPAVPGSVMERWDPDIYRRQ